MRNVMEETANEFAFELLMPTEWLLRDSINIDLCDDKAIAKLAKKYRVPVATIAMRIGMIRTRINPSKDEQP